jgi:hypothetical protein
MAWATALALPLATAWDTASALLDWRALQIACRTAAAVITTAAEEDQHDQQQAAACLAWDMHSMILTRAGYQISTAQTILRRSWMIMACGAAVGSCWHLVTQVSCKHRRAASHLCLGLRHSSATSRGNSLSHGRGRADRGCLGLAKVAGTCRQQHTAEGSAIPWKRFRHKQVLKTA